jgi:hypothetical protein
VKVIQWSRPSRPARVLVRGAIHVDTHELGIVLEFLVGSETFAYGMTANEARNLALAIREATDDLPNTFDPTLTDTKEGE